ncbi:MAG TPA: hypothetical protein VJG83_00555 [archaeon]|nr:hypothetical protein [archaeon]
MNDHVFELAHLSATDQSQVFEILRKMSGQDPAKVIALIKQKFGLNISETSIATAFKRVANKVKKGPSTAGGHRHGYTDEQKQAIVREVNRQLAVKSSPPVLRINLLVDKLAKSNIKVSGVGVHRLVVHMQAAGSMPANLKFDYSRKAKTKKPGGAFHLQFKRAANVLLGETGPRRFNFGKKRL